MDAVIRQWINIVAEEAAGPEGFDTSVQQMAALLFAYKGMLASTQLEWL